MNEKIEIVKVKKVEAYMWECPKCGHFNVQDKENKVTCDECLREFKAQE